MEIRHIAYKFRLYPNQEQQILLSKTFGCVRFVYNYYLNKKTQTYHQRGTTLSYTQCAEDLVLLKNENPFLKEVDSIALQQDLRHLDIAFKNFFRKIKAGNSKAGYPKYKSKKQHHDSYSTVCVNHNIRLEDKVLVLPKVGRVCVKRHREIPEGYILKSVTVSRTPTGKYYASILYEYETEIHPVKAEKVIGLDYSMSELFVSSEEEVSTDEKFLHRYRKSQSRLAKEQRTLSRRKKGSRRYQKQRRKVALLHEKIANQRKDYLHKESRQIANAYDQVCVEDLNMQGMSRALHFGKTVSDNGWGKFLEYLKYKLEEQGKMLIRIDKWYPSSKTCHVCGCVNEELTLSTRSWECPKCHEKHDRDKNAAMNIKAEGIRISKTITP